MTTERIWLDSVDCCIDDLACGTYFTARPSIASIEYVPASLLSAYHTQIREVLEGLRQENDAQGIPCWCGPNVTGGHEDACLAARELWERVQS